MRIRFDIDEASFTRIELSLRRLSRSVPRDAARTLRRAMDRVVAKAKLYAPEDTTALVESIRVEESKVGNRAQFKVTMGGPQMTEWGVPLDHYAVAVHEHYESFVTSGEYMGEGTKKKMAMGIPVGSHFLDRAMEEERDALVRAAAESVKNVIKKEFPR